MLVHSVNILFQILSQNQGWEFCGFLGGSQFRTLNGHITITCDCMQSAVSPHKSLVFIHNLSLSLQITVAGLSMVIFTDHLAIKREYLCCPLVYIYSLMDPLKLKIQNLHDYSSGLMRFFFHILQQSKYIYIYMVLREMHWMFNNYLELPPMIY